MVVAAKPVLAAQEQSDINMQKTQPVEQKATPVAAEPTKSDTESIEDGVADSATAPEQVEPPVQETVQSTPAAAVTCEQAIRQVWPRHLQEGAIKVSQSENRTQDPVAVGAVNNDEHASRDYGCFQINDYWHPNYFTNGDWKNPVWAAQYALTIFNERVAINGNGWSAWYAVKGVLW